MVKNPPDDAGDIRDLVWEDPPGVGMATCTSILVWRSPWTQEPVGYSPEGCKDSDRTEETEHPLMMTMDHFREN